MKKLIIISAAAVLIMLCGLWTLIMVGISRYAEVSATLSGAVPENIEQPETVETDSLDSSKEKPLSGYMPYKVFTGVEDYNSFFTFAEAVGYARSKEKSYIYYDNKDSLIWTNAEETAESSVIAVELIEQYPELPRGCEVTSLAMLLRYHGVDTDKMKLAEEIKKDETPFKTVNGKKYRGNPNNGFVGSMYDMSEDGLGVYHEPVYELAEKYLPGRVHDLTGCEFSDLYYFIDNSMPVWIITNSYYSRVPESEFETWHTPDGEIRITYREHSVLITGYDEENIYFNDPLSDVAGKVRAADFAEAWVQMGSQAVTVKK